MELTDEQWAVLKPILPGPPRRADGRGRPWRDPRAVLNEILRLLRTGAQRQDLPPCDPPYHTCHRRFQLWGRSGVRDHLLWALATDLHAGRDAECRRPDRTPRWLFPECRD